MEMIGFRVWDNHKRIIRNVTSISFNRNGLITQVTYFNNGVRCSVKKCFSLLQYIGKEDKEGNPVFDGYYIEYQDVIYKVSFYKTLSIFALFYDLGCVSVGFIDWSKAKIVGNVYENFSLDKKCGFYSHK